VNVGPALRRRRDDALIAAVLAALALLLTLGGFTWRADRLFYDAALARWSRPAPADIVIVAIDDASIDAIGRWPWPRSVHATLLDRLGAAGPKAVALDLVLSEAEPVGDPWLAAALQRLSTLGIPVVMPVAWQAIDGRLGVLAPTPAFCARMCAWARRSRRSMPTACCATSSCMPARPICAIRIWRWPCWRPAAVACTPTCIPTPTRLRPVAAGAATAGC
jgi:hypothetical protein